MENGLTALNHRDQDAVFNPADDDQQRLAGKGQRIRVLLAVLSVSHIAGGVDLTVAQPGQGGAVGGESGVDGAVGRSAGLRFRGQRRVDFGVVFVEVLHQDAVVPLPLGEAVMWCFVGWHEFVPPLNVRNVGQGLCPCLMVEAKPG